MYDSLETKPSKYIIIPESDDLTGVVKNNTYTTTFNGNYVDILFSAIRSLQSEVARLKNAFKYGINSYTDTATAMSSVVQSPDEEPLWAVDESDLSELSQCTSEINENHILTGDVIVTNQGLDIQNASFIDPSDGFKEQPDPKSFVYLTSSTKNIKFILNPELTIDLETIPTT
jgi:hypothetical protein